MTEIDQTNALDGAAGATSPSSELGQAQIICVIGEVSFAMKFSFVIRC